ncbi:hypothetical protein BCR44DRAFT_44071 [Catenaria anguillulae PL171]|uniref:FAM192A/Fyv6 N-terminal domain-containing protein n=1 Tax=Catenaria anguillulae PL171 TaxID=765915 RepID=A0A1Y2HCS8_9FUNG|nr:hypothetical protein BCR44DRAFT_44071 [Catenaria anguillulae PL171]
MSSFKELLTPAVAKSFVSESALAAERQALIDSYLAQGKQPPTHLVNPEAAAAQVIDTRPLADRLAEQRRQKEDELEAKLSLRNHVPMLDEDDSEYLNDVAEQERRDEQERRRREWLEVERFREMQRMDNEDQDRKVGLDPEAVVKVVAERAQMAGAAPLGKSLVRELLLATDKVDEDEAVGGSPSASGSKTSKLGSSSFLGSASERKRKAKQPKGLVALVVPKSSATAAAPADAVLAAPSKRAASAALDEASTNGQPQPSSPVKKARIEPVTPASGSAAGGMNGLVAYTSDDDDDD